MMPTQQIVYLGFILNTVDMTVRLTREKTPTNSRFSKTGFRPSFHNSGTLGYASRRN